MQYLFFTILSLSFLISESQDVLYLKNGSIIKGKIIENKINDYIKVELSGGSVLKYKYNDACL